MITAYLRRWLVFTTAWLLCISLTTPLIEKDVTTSSCQNNPKANKDQQNTTFGARDINFNTSYVGKEIFTMHNKKHTMKYGDTASQYYYFQHKQRPKTWKESNDKVVSEIKDTDK